MNLNLFSRTMALALLTLLTVSTHAAEKTEHNFERWEKSISQFEKQDQDQGIKKGGNLFVGSSSIRMWDLDKYFPEQHVLNRGFGGSEIVDSTHFADRIIIKHEPEVIFLYAAITISHARKPRKKSLKISKNLSQRFIKVCPKPGNCLHRH